MSDVRPTFYEFFAGGGMARAGLGQEWKCLFANDLDEKKVRAYRSNWSSDEIECGDIYDVEASNLPGCADLAWGSFPCQDLSLAGNGAGLNGARSEAFWGFWQVIDGLRRLGRHPRLLVLENVVGALTSNNGEDFREICRALGLLGYVYGAVTMDAALFVPQSRPRLFIVAVRKGMPISNDLVDVEPRSAWASTALLRVFQSLPPEIKKDWRWWHLPLPSPSAIELRDIIDDNPTNVVWHSGSETSLLLSKMSLANLEKVRRAKETKRWEVGAIYKRTRLDENKKKVQRAEVRFDGLAGCLRTPGGGSSRQFIIIVDGDVVRTRLLSPREAARLMGLSEDYKLPPKYNEAYHLMGDGLAVPVVRHLADHLLKPLLKPASVSAIAAE